MHHRAAAAAMVGKTNSFVFLVLFLSPFIDSTAGATKSYVVYLGGHHDVNVDHQQVVDSHHELLGSVLRSKEAAKEAIFYSYTKSVNGFAAILEEEHAISLSKLPEVLSVFPNRARSLHTTRSWGFLGLEAGAGQSENVNIPERSLWRKGQFGKDVIIAHVDTGVWPESASFDDTDIGPIPSRWKGFCEKGTQFGPEQCNKKLIGGRYFIKGRDAENGPLNLSATGEFRSARDKAGHGTHTLSTAGGNFVKNASVYRHAKGIAKGGAPHARVASYKVCWPTDSLAYNCYDADILAAFDAGIHDGVDVFTVSLGGSPPLPDYFQDAISIGSFHAVQRGRVVVCSAANLGPFPGTVANVAPWILTVAASTIDRDFPSRVQLGNNKTYIGQSLAQFQLPKGKLYPLVSSARVKAPHANTSAGELCFPGSLDPKKVEGKIVACLRGLSDRVEKGLTVRLAGGVGLILANAPEGDTDVDADLHFLPAAHLNATDGAAVFQYIKSTASPVASILSRTQLGVKPTPIMASFSSRGPNTLTPDILKPDITAPGVNILAAISEADTATSYILDNRSVPFNILSGTSMSCPHVAGIVALLKSVHPDWSSAAIKSAIMTTAQKWDNTQSAIKDDSLQRAGPFNYGAGHVYPNKAADPGLVYDLSLRDYNNFFCSLYYNSSQLKAITGKAFNCPARPSKIYNLNYPSITVSALKGSATVRRTVTNVAGGPVTYKAKVQSPDGVSVLVEPAELHFSTSGEKKTFTVSLKAVKSSRGEYVFGSLAWKYGKYSVASPIVVKVSSVN